jgi:hypothetical protein
MFDPKKHVIPIDLIIGAINKALREWRIEEEETNDNGNEVVGFRNN